MIDYHDNDYVIMLIVRLDVTMTARMYSLATNLSPENKKYVGGLRGQAKIVYEELVRDRTPRLAEAINKVTGPKFVTKQDTLRVTLYYIIVFKGRGIVVAHEPTRAEERFTGFDNIEVASE